MAETKRAALTYFDLRGRAEAARLWLHARGIEFEDRRIVSGEQWAALEPTLPFGSLPLYEEGGEAICQSQAILRHLYRSRAAGPASASLAAELDTTQEFLAEAQEDLWRFNWRKGYYDQLEGYAAETLEPTLSRLEGWLRRDGRAGTFFVGDALSHVDCLAFVYLDEIDAFFPATLEAFPPLAAFRARIERVPGVHEYLQSDERPPVFGIGSMGPKIDPRSETPKGRMWQGPWSKPIELLPFVLRQRRLTDFSR